MPAPAQILLAAGFTAGACLASGNLLLRALRLRFRREEKHIFAFVSGAACWSGLVFLLAAAGLARRGVFLVAGLLVILAALKWGRSQPAPPPEPAPPRLPPFWKALFGVIFAAFAVLYFFNALAPEISPDGSTYHLGLVARYLREHGFQRITTNMYANLSQGMEMLFLFAFAFGKHSAAALVHFAFLLTLPLAMLAYTRRIGFPRAGVVGSLLVFASPIVGVAGISAYNDVAVACVVFTVFYLLEIWDQQPSPALLVPIGLLAGFGYAIKYTAFLAVPYALGRVGWKLWRARQPVRRPLAVISLCALLMIVPWMAKNWILLGNPVSPFFNRFFPNPYVRISFEQEYSQHMRHYLGLDSYWAIPLEATVRGEVLHGMLGPLFLLAPLALLGLRYPPGRRLLLAAGVFAVTYATNVGTRFLVPSLPFLSLAMGLAVLTSWRWVAPGIIVAHGLLSWPGILGLYCRQHTWRLKEIPVQGALRKVPEGLFVAERQPRYTTTRVIEGLVPPGGKVFTFGGALDAYTSRELLVGYQSAQANLLADILLAPVLLDEQPLWELQFRFPAQPVRKLRVVQTAGPAPGEWNVRELRVFRGKEELPRAPHWRLQAYPNPWDVQLAFDNSLVTRWRSWQTLFPGMFLEIDFRGLQNPNSLSLECSPDQGAIRLRVDAETASGEWKTLADSFVTLERRRPSGLRQLASEEFKARGVDYLLLYDYEDWAREFWSKRKSWGLTLLDHQRAARLYWLD